MTEAGERRAISDNPLTILDALEVGVFITAPDCEIIGINSHFEKVTTITRDEVLGRNVQYLLDKGYIAKSICQRVVKEQKQVTDILHYKNIGRDVIVTGKPVFDAAGRLQFIVCTLRDWELLTDLYKKLRATKRESEQYKEQIRTLTRQHQADSDYIVAKDEKIKKMLQMAARIAKVDSTVLLLGESGVGKDMLAKCIHRHSPRADRGSFVHVNCGAIPETLFEAEFFGYAAGAFTGASRAGKPGLIEIAAGGTLFLDEIAELPLFMQAKLLKVLQEKSITRVGGTQEKKADVRVIAATNKDLEALVESGQFRQDLFYRLNVFRITIPSLRERRDDIPPLISFFLRKFNEKYRQSKTMRPEAVEALLAHDWPGNVRELEHTIERLVVLCPDEVIETGHLPESFAENLLVAEAIRLSGVLPLKTIIEKVEKAVIMNSIGNTETLQDTARQLGVDLSTLTRKKQKYGIFKKRAGLHSVGADPHIEAR